MDPWNVVNDLQIYRIYTSAFFHGGLFHIGMNMLSTYAIGIQLERLFGTIKLATIMFYILTISGVMCILICYGLFFLLNDNSRLRYRSIGFSGVIFGLAVIESFL